MATLFRSSGKWAVGILRGNCSLMQVANLTGRTTRGEPLKLKIPFPYNIRKITHLEALLDVTIRHVENENAKLIVVEGPIAAGKTAFMEQLAREFDLLHMPQPTMDTLYITRAGFDLRTFDDQIPETVRSFDHKNFCMCPNHFRVPSFQLHMFNLNFGAYIDALCHILNSGQGVIMERSVFSQICFVQAMIAVGYLPKHLIEPFTFLRAAAEPLLLKPHVVIYLDVPVPKVQERIKQRNYSYEVNSPALTVEYLQQMEHYCKEVYLKEASKQSVVLVYDWSEGGDTDLVIEDLEKLDLDPLKQKEYGLFYDWKSWKREWRMRRIDYTNHKTRIMRYLDLPFLEYPELLVPTEDAEKREDIYKTAPGMEYEYGFNRKLGDSLFFILLGMNLVNDRSPACFMSK